MKVRKKRRKKKMPKKSKKSRVTIERDGNVVEQVFDYAKF